MEMLSNMRSFDAYPKTVEDFRIRTNSGGIVSIISAIIMFWLFFSELSLYLGTEIKPELSVDTSRSEQLRINFNIVFPHMPCAFLSLDAMDVSGNHQLDIIHHVYKKRLTSDGKPIKSSVEKQDLARDEASVDILSDKDDDNCGSCYGAETEENPCCNTCEQVREAYRKKGWAFSSLTKIEQCMEEGFEDKLKEQKDEGCNTYGYLHVNKVAGNFHFAPGKSFQQNHMHIHDLDILKFAKGFNLSHTINYLSFGIEYPNSVYPLDEVSKSWEDPDSSASYSYFIQVVPTSYEDLAGRQIESSQFSVTEYEKSTESGRSLPGVFFVYDLSPIKVYFKETSKSFAHFLTSVCAIIGGVFTISAIIDSFVYQGLRSLEKKVELGKFA
eukprot:TRINITY_DN8641_c0_g1_i1.p1 TRINITY_DN8641_c0_g1~~TRINITY_DN8641_c0_g1_i1.p1  ORF type:complete len:384 (-),score=71.40 TRINITY_DN8641_c0_g1_i1:43-1194(-)